MDRAQLRNDTEEAMRLVLDGRQSCLWTALPGIIQSVDLTAMTCEVQPAIQGTIEDEDGNLTIVNLPLLVDVPIIFPSSGGFALTFPMAQGDEVLVVMASRCIDAWWQQGGVQKPMEARMHDLSDGFAIPGPKSQPRKISAISSTKVSLRNNAGTVYFSVGTKFCMKNATTDLKTLLADLVTAVNSLVTATAAITVTCATPGSPSSPPINVAAITAVASSLSAVNTKITGLLDAL